MQKTFEDIAKDLYANYKQGKDANNGGLSFIKEPKYNGLLMGFYINARIAVYPETGLLAFVNIA